MDKIIFSGSGFRRLWAMIRAARHHWRWGSYVNWLERELRRADGHGRWRSSGLLYPPESIGGPHR
jgi:hypothetical protein